MKNIQINCLSNDSLCINKCHICIYDLNEKLIFEDYTNELGFVTFKPSHYGFYKIIIENKIKCEKLCTSIFINKNFCDKLLFKFSNKKYHSIKVNLIDKYYGIPIEKGVITLWQKNI